jgi:hypothetical protein
MCELVLKLAYRVRTVVIEHSSRVTSPPPGYAGTHGKAKSTGKDNGATYSSLTGNPQGYGKVLIWGCGLRRCRAMHTLFPQHPVYEAYA